MDVQAKRIKILLLERDITQREVARRLGVTPGLITNVIKGRATSQYVKDGIARILGDPHVWKDTPSDRGSVSENLSDFG